MRSFMRYYLDLTGLGQQSGIVLEKMGVDPFDTEWLTLTNISTWYNVSLTWLFFLKSTYLEDRTHTIKKIHPEYTLSLPLFSHLFHDNPEKSLAFLQKLDAVALKAIGEHFPDVWFPQTFAPNGGPFYDLFVTLNEKKQSIPPSLLTPFNLALALRISKRPKDIVTLENINKDDVLYLAEFLSYLSKNPQHTNRISNYLAEEKTRLLMLVAFTPKRRLLTLQWDVSLIEKCFQNLFNALDSYDKDPDVALALLEEINE